MKTRLRMKCKACGHWNRVPVNKIFLEQNIKEDSKSVKRIKGYWKRMYFFSHNIIS
jgi:hypothetical protein